MAGTNLTTDQLSLSIFAGTSLLSSAPTSRCATPMSLSLHAASDTLFAPGATDVDHVAGGLDNGADAHEAELLPLVPNAGLLSSAGAAAQTHRRAAAFHHGQRSQGHSEPSLTLDDGILESLSNPTNIVLTPSGSADEHGVSPQQLGFFAGLPSSGRNLTDALTRSFSNPVLRSASPLGAAQRPSHIDPAAAPWPMRPSSSIGRTSSPGHASSVMQPSRARKASLSGSSSAQRKKQQQFAFGSSSLLEQSLNDHRFAPAAQPNRAAAGTYGRPKLFVDTSLARGNNCQSKSAISRKNSAAPKAAVADARTGSLGHSDAAAMSHRLEAGRPPAIPATAVNPFTPSGVIAQSVATLRLNSAAPTVSPVQLVQSMFQSAGLAPVGPSLGADSAKPLIPSATQRAAALANVAASSAFGSTSSLAHVHAGINTPIRSPSYESQAGGKSGPACATAASRRRRTEHSNFIDGPGFSETQQLAGIYSAGGRTEFGVTLVPKMDRGFFKAEEFWTCYRRNYFQVSSGFAAHAVGTGMEGLSLPCLVRRNDETTGEMVVDKVVRFCIGVSSRTSESDTTVDIVQHTTKRDKGPINVPQPTPVIPGGCPSSFIGPEYHDFVATFERLQFKVATAPSGSASSKKRAMQQLHWLVIELWAECQDPTSSDVRRVLVAVCESDPLVVRSRSPAHYADNGMQASQSVASASAASARTPLWPDLASPLQSGYPVGTPLGLTIGPAITSNDSAESLRQMTPAAVLPQFLYPPSSMAEAQQILATLSNLEREQLVIQQRLVDKHLDGSAAQRLRGVGQEPTPANSNLDVHALTDSDMVRSSFSSCGSCGSFGSEAASDSAPPSSDPLRSLSWPLSPPHATARPPAAPNKTPSRSLTVCIPPPSPVSPGYVPAQQRAGGSRRASKGFAADGSVSATLPPRYMPYRYRTPSQSTASSGTACLSAIPLTATSRLPDPQWQPATAAPQIETADAPARQSLPAVLNPPVDSAASPSISNDQTSRRHSFPVKPQLTIAADHSLPTISMPLQSVPSKTFNPAIFHPGVPDPELDELVSSAFADVWPVDDCLDLFSLVQGSQHSSGFGL